MAVFRHVKFAIVAWFVGCVYVGMLLCDSYYSDFLTKFAEFWGSTPLGYLELMLLFSCDFTLGFAVLNRLAYVVDSLFDDMSGSDDGRR